MFSYTALALVVIGILILSSAVKVLREYERAVIFRLGRSIAMKGPGLILLIPIVDKFVRISLRTVAMDVPPQDVITRDNVSVKVNAVIYFRVLDPTRAVVEVENYLYATSQISQTTLRSVLGESDLDELLSNRDKINKELQRVIDGHTEPWGVKVSTVEVKNVDLPQEMQRAIARQAEAERERRAKVINAEGELQASHKLAEAAAMIGTQPLAIQLRYLQTLSEIATENNSTTLFPIPIDLFEPLIRMRDRLVGGAPPPPTLPGRTP
ncbi:MAG TPA: slipin family protein [Candidatus Eisenbacteria bacterium]|jgi:regulator of protease activity HflC (stomatin/prohibitin superfamily)|nr:slipin family protein [Candidatus Eisenbacteria bacterium]